MSPASRPAMPAHAEREEHDRRSPVSSETRRACHRPTPKSANDTYSRPVKTGAMYIGFQRSWTHAPNIAMLRALWTHAPSSCQTMPTVARHGRIGVGKDAAQQGGQDQMSGERHAEAARSVEVGHLHRTVRSNYQRPPVESLSPELSTERLPRGSARSDDGRAHVQRA